MSPATTRAAAIAMALSMFAACGGKPAAPGPLELACSVSFSGPNPVLTVLGRARSSAAASAPPVTVTMDLQPTPVTFTLSGPAWTGAGEFRPGNLRVGMPLVGQAIIDGAFTATTCIAQSGLAPFDASAVRTSSGVDLAWDAVAGAAVYRWSLREGTSGALLGSGSTTTGTSAQITATIDATDDYLAEVGAYALAGSETSFPVPLPRPATAFARTTLTAGRTFGDGASAWQLFGPGDYLDGTLTVKYPALATGERLAILLVNADGDDTGYATVSTSGTGDPTLALAPASPLMARARPTGPAAGPGDSIDRSGAQAGEALVSAWREETIARLRDGRLQRAVRVAGPRLAATAAAAALPTTRFFCQGQLVGAGFIKSWKSATLAYQTPEGHAAFYYTDEVKPGIDKALLSRPDFFTTLGVSYESKILPQLNTFFGPESDVDQNGLVIFLFANLGKSGASMIAGYFSPEDIELPQSTAASCSRNGTGNVADMLYLLDPGNFATNWDPTGTNYLSVLNSIVDEDYPTYMAHELQHNVNYNARFPIGGAWGVDEELWLNEGMSMLSETVAGFGLHTARGRADVRTYQGRSTSASLPYYQGYGMTIWPATGGDPYGNYAGAQAYMQYLLDHATPAMTRALENPWLAGKANVENATGVPWELGMARFATAAMFSNEDTSATPGGAISSAGNQLGQEAFNFLGDGVQLPYVPWHHYMDSCSIGGVTYDKPRDAYVAYTPLSSTSYVSLRTDGWAAFATGQGSGAPATITVLSAAAVHPYAVVVKYTGMLPNYSFDSTCP